jgi:hypothetical protein
MEKKTITASRLLILDNSIEFLSTVGIDNTSNMEIVVTDEQGAMLPDLTAKVAELQVLNKLTAKLKKEIHAKNAEPEFEAYCQTCDPTYTEKVLERGTLEDCTKAADRHQKRWTHLTVVYSIAKLNA